MADELKAENRLESKVVVGAAKFGENRAAMVALLAALRGEEDGIRLGGGAKAAEAQRAKGRLTVRERLGLLLDPEPLETQVRESGPGAPGSVGPDKEGSGLGSNFLELGLWAALWDVLGVWRGAGGGRGDGVGAGEWAALHDRGE